MTASYRANGYSRLSLGTRSSARRAVQLQARNFADMRTEVDSAERGCCSFCIIMSITYVIQVNNICYGPLLCKPWRLCSLERAANFMKPLHLAISRPGSKDGPTLSNAPMPGGTQERRKKRKSEEIRLEALSLRRAKDVSKIQEDVLNRAVVILKVTPLAQESLDKLKSSVEQLYEFATAIGGDIARLGDERVIIAPPGVKVEKSRIETSN